MGKNPAPRKVSCTGALFTLIRARLISLELRRLTQELQGHVICLGADPANVGRYSTHLVTEDGDTLANFRLDIEGYKESHGLELRMP